MEADEWISECQKSVGSTVCSPRSLYYLFTSQRE